MARSDVETFNTVGTIINQLFGDLQSRIASADTATDPEYFEKKDFYDELLVNL